MTHDMNNPALSKAVLNCSGNTNRAESYHAVEKSQKFDCYVLLVPHSGDWLKIMEVTYSWNYVPAKQLPLK